MFQRPGLIPRVMCAAVVAIAGLAGCRQAPATLSVVPGARGTAVVTADPAALLRGLEARRVLGAGFREAGITTLRLVSKVPGGAVVTGPTIAYSPSNPAVMPAGPLTMTVTAGPNRLFMLEGLDAEGRTIADVLTAATLTNGSTFALTFNAETAIVADVIDTAYDTAGATKFQLDVAAGDVVAPLLAYVNASVGLNKATNQFSGVDPLAYDRALLVSQLAASGLSGLSATPPASLSTPIWGRLIVQPTQYNGRTPFSATAVQAIDLYDPLSGQLTAAAANAAGEFVFPQVPLGSWHVRIQTAGGAPAGWHKVTVKGDTFARLMAVPPPAAPTTPIAAGVTPAIAGNPATGATLLVWQNGTENESEIMGQLYDPNRAAVGAPFAISQRPSFADQEPAVVHNPVTGQFVVAWSDGAGSVFARSVSATGVVAGQTYAATSDGLAEPALACNSTSGAVLLAWNGSGSFEALKLSQDAAGTLTGQSLNSLFSDVNIGRSPVVAYNRIANEFMLAYVKQASDRDLYAHTIDGGLTALVNSNQLIAGGPGDQQSPAIASRSAIAALPHVVTSAADHEFLLAWEDHAVAGAPVIRGRRVPGGIAATPHAAVQLSEGAGNFRPRVDYMPNAKNAAGQVVANAEHFLVSWEHLDGGKRDIQARRVAAGVGQPLDQRGELTFAIDGIPDTRPAVWADPAHFDYVVVWQGDTAIRQGVVR